MENKMRIVIVLSGKKGSGKTTLAKALGFRRFAFADALKDMLSTGISVTREVCDTDKNTKIDWLGGKTVGQLLQYLGDGVREHVSQDFFVSRTVHDIATKTGDHETCIVEDCRFVNEYLALKRTFKTITVRLTGRSSEDSRDPGHSSETELDKVTGWDFVFNTLLTSPEDMCSILNKAIEIRAR